MMNNQQKQWEKKDKRSRKVNLNPSKLNKEIRINKKGQVLNCNDDVVPKSHTLPTFTNNMRSYLCGWCVML